jgi:hypothetical protein
LQCQQLGLPAILRSNAFHLELFIAYNAVSQLVKKGNGFYFSKNCCYLHPSILQPCCMAVIEWQAAIPAAACMLQTLNYAATESPLWPHTFTQISRRFGSRRIPRQMRNFAGGAPKTADDADDRGYGITHTGKWK